MVAIKKILAWQRILVLNSIVFSELAIILKIL